MVIYHHIEVRSYMQSAAGRSRRPADFRRVKRGQWCVITTSYIASRSCGPGCRCGGNPGFCETARYLLLSETTASTMISN